MVVSKCENALKGTALLGVELGVPAEDEPLLVLVVLGLRTLTGGVSVVAEGVKSAVVVSAFEPAEVEP